MPEKYHSFRVEAIVLRHADWGEADRILTLYTRERGKLRVVAKGARRIKSRKAGHLEPFTRVVLQMAKSHTLPIVTQAETVNAYLPLRDDLVKTATASTVVEMLDRFTYEDESENPSAYRLLAETLERITTLPDSWVAVRYYEIQLLDFLGYRPQLVTCVNCGEEIQPEDQYFSVAQGGVLCPRCGAGLPGARPISMEALKILRHFQRSAYPKAQRAQPRPEVRAEVEAILQMYITYLLERELKSPEFLKQVRG
ncbi:MAG: DNA repair protein RecO [Chloroflexota bacterium]